MGSIPTMWKRAAFACVSLSSGLVWAAASRPWGDSSFQGMRDYQEDRWVVQEKDVGTLYAVFDGHGGALTSETARKTFADHFFGNLAAGGQLRLIWAKTFRDTEESYRVASEGKDDNDGSKRTEGREGATCNAAFIAGDRLSTANAGDSRCVVCQRDGSALPMSVDHKPLDKGEFERLKKHGFQVVRGRIYRQDNGRGGLNLSRALGDFLYEKGVPCTPDVFSKTLTPNDVRLILGTDGLWDVLSNEQ